MPTLSDGGNRRLPASRRADGPPALVDATSTCAVIGTLAHGLRLVLTDEAGLVPPGLHVAWSGALRTPLGQLVLADILTGEPFVSMPVGRYTGITVYVDSVEQPATVIVLAAPTTPSQMLHAKRPPRAKAQEAVHVVVPASMTEIVATRRRWPHGLVIFEDRDLRSAGPDGVGEGDAVVWSTDQVIVSTILHEVDGVATARVWTGPGEPSDLHLVHDAKLEIRGSISVVTTGGRTGPASTAPLGPGQYRARVFVDQVPHAENVVLVLQ